MRHCALTEETLVYKRVFVKDFGILEAHTWAFKWLQVFDPARRPQLQRRW